MELLWTPQAFKDRDEIYDYIEANNPTAALALDELFLTRAARLVDHPGLGRPDRIAGTRELVVHAHYLRARVARTACRQTLAANSRPRQVSRHTGALTGTAHPYRPDR